MKQQRSKFLNFLFALIPGAAQMYMGFMLRGLSLMGAACLVIMISIFLDSVMLGFLFPLIWFYAFFDAINLNSMHPEQFQNQPDEPFYCYLLGGRRLNFSQKTKSVLGVVLICIGGFVFTSNLFELFYDWMPDSIYYLFRNLLYELPRIAAALLLVWIGIRVIVGKKTPVADPYAPFSDDAINRTEDAQ